MAITEFAYSVNDFQTPKTYENEEAIAVILTRLLLLEPGTYQQFPNMGVGLFSKYHGGLENDCTGLKIDFENQINMYLPNYFKGTQINVSIKEKTLIITAEIEGALYGINYDPAEEKMDIKFTKISNL